MSSTINLSLTDELKEFIQKNSGDGTLHSTPSDFVRDLLRHEMDRKEAEIARNNILKGYQDAIKGKVNSYDGDLQVGLAKFRASKK